MAGCLGAACLFLTGSAAADPGDDEGEGASQTLGAAAGVALVATGSAGALGGSIAYFALGSQASEDPAGYRTEKTASVLALVLGGAAIAGGVPLIISFTRANPAAPPATARPQVQVGLGAASLAWSW